MTGKGNQVRPVRTLEVDNFSVIRKATLEFGRITVLIGPQAKGKSLICKLAYFLGWETTTVAARALVDRKPWSDFLEAIRLEFVSRFSTAGWLRTDSQASFSSYLYSVRVRGAGDPLNPQLEFTFSNRFRELYESNLGELHRQPVLLASTRGQLQQDFWIEISHLLNPDLAQSNIYIPSGRQFFTVAAKSVAALDSPGLDDITRRFAGLIAWDTRWKVGMTTSGRGVLQEIGREIERIAGGVVVMTDGEPTFLSQDGRRLPLSMLSSGTSELLPMLNVLTYLAYAQEHSPAPVRSPGGPFRGHKEFGPLIFVEEPESHVFPETQRELVNLFAWMSNDPFLSFDWVITTHSPYVLTAFNTLLEAWRAGQSTPKHKQVSALIPERYWINENEFAAYGIRDGFLAPIFRKEADKDRGTGLIDADYLDSVSSAISSEFSKLLEIEFGNAR